MKHKVTVYLTASFRIVEIEDTCNRQIKYVLNERIDYSQCNTIHSTLTDDHDFNYGLAGKQPVALEKYCANYC